MTAPHIPVMLQEVLHYLHPQAGETYVDGTFGAGGYSQALLEKADCHVIALDQDLSVQPYAAALQQKFPDRFTFVHGNFAHMAELLAARSITKVHGVVLDIGVSSMQLDQAERGFSFMQDGPLDMRMSGHGRTAADFVNQASEKEIADVIYRYGGERKSRAIARKIVEKRSETPFERTSQLASLVRSIVRAAPHQNDGATRTFQAIRIWVNDELGALESGLKQAESLLLPSGRLIVVTFHSLEDGIVKQYFRDASGYGQTVSRHLPMQHAVAPIRLSLITKQAIAPSEEEIQRNPRARSAKLRAAIRQGEAL